MKKISTLLLILGSCVATASAQKAEIVKPGLSPLTRHYLLELRTRTNALPQGYIYKTGDDGRQYVSAMIKVANAGQAQEGLTNIGALVNLKAGNIWTVQVPIEQVEAFTQMGGISYIQVDEPVFPKLDQARKTTRVDSVHKGINLPIAYSGKGVVVGVIDFGFDYNHPSFYDTLGGRFRIKKVWELNSNGTHPTGYNYGRELADTNAIKAATTDNAAQTHGTCVAGMAAGSGYAYSTVNAVNSKYRGMAYDADMVFVGVRRDTIATQWMQGGFSDFANGVGYIFNYANAIAKPAVINISWGSQSGSHDGTSLFNQACDNLSGPGKLIVMSAGNEGQEHIHLGKTFTPTDTMISTNLTFSPTTYQRTWVDVWGDPGKTFCGRATLYRNGAPVAMPSFVCLDSNTHLVNLIGSNGTDTCIVEFINTMADQNGKPRMTINVFNKTTDTVRIDVKGMDGSINMWNEYYYYGYDYKYQSSFSKLGQAWATEGDSISTVSDMGSAQSVLLVGAYVSKRSWTDINGTPWSYSATIGGLAGFSSVGPMIDGRTKPDITAPGITIATACNSFDTTYSPLGGSSALIRAGYVNPTTNKTYYYSEFSGTSAASPAAAGITALLLQVKPTLTPAELKTLLFQTAIKDAYTGTIPAGGKNNWGYGKINAYGAVKQLVQDLGVYAYAGTKKLDCVVYPNPGTGNFRIDYEGDGASTLNIAVYNMAGALVTTDSWPVKAGFNQRPLNLAHLAKGTYMVSIKDRTGSVSIKTVLD